MSVWRAELDAETCDWCRSRHGKSARPPTPKGFCRNPTGCRCVEEHAPDATLMPADAPVLLSVSVVYDVAWPDDRRAFLHTRLAAAPYDGASVEWPGLDRAIEVRHVLFRREAVVLRCFPDEPLTGDDEAALRLAGWEFLE